MRGGGAPDFPISPRPRAKSTIASPLNIFGAVLGARAVSMGVSRSDAGALADNTGAIALSENFPIF